MENPSSPLDTLRQLKEMLDAGALTPTEFEALKQRLVFTAPAAPGPAAPPAATQATDASAGSVTPVVAAVPVVPVVPAAPAAPAAPPASAPALPNYTPLHSPPPPTQEAERAAFEPALEPLFTPSVSADFQITPIDARYVAAETLADDDVADFAAAPAARSSSLGLLLAIGAVLVFLAVVAYLGFTRPASEHISSTSQTAADSVATTIETGPQVAPLPAAAAAAAPETVRVAPTNPAPALPSRAEVERQAAAMRDSVAATVSPAAADSAVRQ